MGNNDYEFELVSRLFIGINTLLNPRHSCKVGLKQSDFIKLEEAAAVLEKFCFCAVYGGGEFTEAHTEDKAEPEEVPAEDEDEAEPEEVPAEDEDKAKPEEVPAEYEDKAEPEEVPALTYDKFSIYCFYEDGYRVAFPVRDNFYNYGLILHMYSNRFEFSNSELSSSTVLNVFNLNNNIHGDLLSICICPTFFDLEYTKPEEVPAEDEDKAEPEEVPAEDEDKAELEEVPAEDEDEAEPEQVPAEDEDKAEPEQVLSNKKCFFNAHCCTSDCPNIQFDIADQRYGYGIAEDMGLKRISCKECYYYTCKCENCLFFNVCTTLKS